MLSRFWVSKSCNYTLFTCFLVVVHEIEGVFSLVFNLLKFTIFGSRINSWLGLFWLFVLSSSLVSPCFGIFIMLVLFSLVAIEAEIRLGSKFPSSAAQFLCSTIGFCGLV